MVEHVMVLMYLNPEKSRDKGSWYLEAGGPGLNRECPNRDYQGGKNTQRQPGPFVVRGQEAK